MKLCITAAGNDISAATDAAFGRAPWFVLVDTESGITQGIENVSSRPRREPVSQRLKP